jgi:hypothetical protein
MPVPSSIADLSQTPASNFPIGSEYLTTADDYFRAHGGFIAELRDKAGVSVTDAAYGAVGDGSTDDTAAIQACIDANPAKTIFFPKGNYKVTAQITVSTDKTKLIGESATITQHTVDIDTVVFEPTTAGTTSAYLNFPEIRGITVSMAAAVYGAHTTGAAIKFRQCNGWRCEFVTINDSFEGIVVMGGQMGSIRSPRLYASQGSYAGAGTAMLHFRQAPYSSGPTLYQPCYTVDLSDVKGTVTLLREAVIRVSNIDGLQMRGGYIGNGKNCNILIMAERDSSYVAAFTMEGVYNDCVGAGKTKTGIEIRDDGFASSYVYMVKVGAGCIIGNGDEYGILCSKTNTQDITVDGASILNMGLYAINVDGSSSMTDLSIVGGTKLQNCGDGTSGVVRANNGRNLTVGGGVQFTGGNANICLLVAGTWGAVSIVGASNSDSIAEVNYSGATISYGMTIAGNTGRDTNTSTSWSGIRPGTTPVADANRLDYFAEGTFTPTVNFAGSAVGLTYSSQVGFYTRIAKRVFFTLQVTLSAKGSSTGVLNISGLPFTANASLLSPVSMWATSLTSGVGDTMLMADVSSGGTSVRISKIAAGLFTQLTDADLTDTSRFVVNGSYEVA